MHSIFPIKGPIILHNHLLKFLTIHSNVHISFTHLLSLEVKDMSIWPKVNQAPTSALHTMDEVWMGNIFSLHSCPIANPITNELCNMHLHTYLVATKCFYLLTYLYNKQLLKIPYLLTYTTFTH
jgi:hypothetical protein